MSSGPEPERRRRRQLLPDCFGQQEAESGRLLTLLAV